MKWKAEVFCVVALILCTGLGYFFLNAYLKQSNLRSLPSRDGRMPDNQMVIHYEEEFEQTCSLRDGVYYLETETTNFKMTYKQFGKEIDSFSEEGTNPFEQSEENYYEIRLFEKNGAIYCALKIKYEQLPAVFEVEAEVVVIEGDWNRRQFGEKVALRFTDESYQLVKKMSMEMTEKSLKDVFKDDFKIIEVETKITRSEPSQMTIEGEKLTYQMFERHKVAEVSLWDPIDE